MQKLNLHLQVNGEPRELLQALRQLRVAGLEVVRLEALSRVPRSIRSEWLWLNPVRGRDVTRTRADLDKLVSVGRIDLETKAELTKLIDEIEKLRTWVKDEGMN